MSEAERARKLIRFCPDFDPDESEKRELWVTPSLHSWLYRKEGKADFKPRIQAHLGHFVVGGFIDNEEFMKTWPTADGVYELRVQFESKPVPENTRIFGGFLQQDCFVATRQRPRSYFTSDPKWAAEIDKAKNDWASICGAKLRLTDFQQCVSENAWDVRKGERW